jgi:hypothetical protein
MVNLLSVAIISSALVSMFYYWATAKNRWLKAAYLGATLNGFLLVWINWALSGRERVPEIGWSGVDWTSDTSATNVFSILCVFMVIAGIRGLWRLRKEKGRQDE